MKLEVADFMTVKADEIYAMLHANGLDDYPGEELGLFRKDDLFIINRPRVMSILERYRKGDGLLRLSDKQDDTSEDE